MKKPKDTARLDWMQKQRGSRGILWYAEFAEFRAFAGVKVFRGRTVRKAIDAAMRSASDGGGKA